MTGNFQEFIGMASFVTAATVFVVGVIAAVVVVADASAGVPYADAVEKRQKG